MRRILSKLRNGTLAAAVAVLAIDCDGANGSLANVDLQNAQRDGVDGQGVALDGTDAQGAARGPSADGVARPGDLTSVTVEAVALP